MLHLAAFVSVFVSVSVSAFGSVWFRVRLRLVVCLVLRLVAFWLWLVLRLVLLGSVRLCVWYRVWYCVCLFGSVWLCVRLEPSEVRRTSVGRLTELDYETQIDSFDFCVTHDGDKCAKLKKEESWSTSITKTPFPCPNSSWTQCSGIPHRARF